MIEVDTIQRALSELVTVDQAAQLAGVHPATARRAFDRGQLDGFRTPTWGRMIVRRSAERWAIERNAGGRLAA